MTLLFPVTLNFLWLLICVCVCVRPGRAAVAKGPFVEGQRARLVSSLAKRLGNSHVRFLILRGSKLVLSRHFWAGVQWSLLILRILLVVLVVEVLCIREF